MERGEGNVCLARLKSLPKSKIVAETVNMEYCRGSWLKSEDYREQHFASNSAKGFRKELHP